MKKELEALRRMRQGEETSQLERGPITATELDVSALRLDADEAPPIDAIDE